MTWAPRGIFRTMSLRVGRSTRKLRPVEPLTRAALGAADDVVVGQHAGVGVEGGARHQREEVAPLLGIDEEHPLPRLEVPRHGPQASVAGGVLRSRTVMSSCSPGDTLMLDTGLERSFRTRRRKKVAPASRNQYQLPATPRRTPARRNRRSSRSTSEPPDLDDGGLGAAAPTTGQEGQRQEEDADRPGDGQAPGCGGAGRGFALAHHLGVGGLEVSRVMRRPLLPALVVVPAISSLPPVLRSLSLRAGR